MDRKDYEFLNKLYDILEDCGVLDSIELDKFGKILDKIESEVK